MWPFSSPQEAVIPIGQYISEPLGKAVPAKTDWLTGTVDFAKKVGDIFDAGWDIYKQIEGRLKAADIIDKDIVPISKPLITVGVKPDVGAFYQDNKTLVWIVSGAMVLFGLAIIIPKYRR